MTKNVMKRASPISTCVGGTEGVPSACRRKESTTIIRVKEVTMTRIAGNMDNKVINSSSSKGVDMPKKLLPAAGGGAGAAKTTEGKLRAKSQELRAKSKRLNVFSSALSSLAFTLSSMLL